MDPDPRGALAPGEECDAVGGIPNDLQPICATTDSPASIKDPDADAGAAKRAAERAPRGERALPGEEGRFGWG